jgi:uncharacterized protein YxeA
MIMIIIIIIMIMMSGLLLLSHGVLHRASESATGRHSSAVSVSYSNIPAEELSALYDLFNTTDGDSWQWKGSSGRWNFSATGA